MGRSFAAFVAGLVFALGLAIGGMTDPLKVLGFLDFAGAWDPSLAFVMAGAIIVFAPFFRVVTRRRAPLLDASFHLPAQRSVDRQLVLGATLFGIGWGLGGYCPGPAFVSSVSLQSTALVFTASMLAGMAIHALTRRDK